MQKILLNYVKSSLNFRTQTTLRTCLTKWDVALDTIKKCATTQYFKLHSAESNANSLDLGIIFSNATKIDDNGLARRYEVTKMSSDPQNSGYVASSSSLNERAGNLKQESLESAVNTKWPNKPSESLEFQQKALDMLNNETMPNFEKIGNTLHQIGLIHIDQRRHDEALRVLTEAIVSTNKAKPVNHVLIGDILNDIVPWLFSTKKNTMSAYQSIVKR